MDTRPLRRLLRDKGTPGLLLVGAYLLGYSLFVRKRRFSLGLLLGAIAISGWLLGQRVAVHQGIPTMPATPSVIHSQSPRYSITDIGLNIGRDLNNRGEIVGKGSKANTAGVIFLWENGHTHEIGTLPDKTSGDAGGINTEGHIAGRANNGDNLGIDSALIYRDGKLTPLFEDGRISAANGINDRDQVVGAMDVRNKGIWRAVMHPFLWENDKVTDLGTFGGKYGEAVSINAHGQIVGYAADENEKLHAFLWANGTRHELTPGKYSEAYAINDQGAVVGALETENLESIVFIWRNDAIQTLPTPGPGLCIPHAINDKGQVVGMWWPKGEGFNSEHAILWEKEQMIDLNEVISAGTGWHLQDADSINDHGWITGYGQRDGKQRAFLLRPER